MRSIPLGLALIVCTVLAACTGGAGPAPALVSRPAPAATAAHAAATLPAASAATAPAAGEGGLTADEPTSAAAVASIVSPTVTPAPMATAAAPAATPTATRAPSPTTTSAPSPAATPATATPAATTVATRTFSSGPDPLQIEVMRRQPYPGSAITFEQTLAPGANYRRYIVSYLSDGLKIYALMTVPNGQKPATGWPVIIFNHGYIPPSVYRTTERYVAYVDAIARAGYIVFKSDYRGHGNSEGEAPGGYGSPAYTVDVLNALASLQAYPDADPKRIGMWGHSMGGQVTLRAMVVSKDIKAGVIWGGVVAPYKDIMEHWTHRPGAAPEYIPPNQRRWRQEMIARYGTPEQNPAFWASVSPNSYLADISGPLQLDASITDEEVPVEFSQTLYAELQAAGKTSELYTYPGDNHNISGNFATAMARSIAFFDRYVKGQ